MTNYQFILKVFRKLYTSYISKQELPPLERETDVNVVSGIIRNLLQDDKPCMIARFGAFELATIVNYLGIQQGPQSAIKYIKGDALDWWWNKRLIGYMKTNAGFFPTTEENLSLFCRLMLEDCKQVDLLGSWLNEESIIEQTTQCSFSRVRLRTLNPFWSQIPWTYVLKGKKVLIVSPFIKSIESQYKKRAFLFENPNTLPDFKELYTIKAVQSIGTTVSGYESWFDALEHMKEQISLYDFDIALLGCGAYGFPLAAYIKRIGKKAVHIGGSLQLLFGIKGKRWDNIGLYNEYWIRPLAEEIPESLKNIENGCYI